VVAAEVDVHEARDEVTGVSVAVVLDALDERIGAVTHAHDCDSDFAAPLGGGPAVVAIRCAVLGGHRRPLVLIQTSSGSTSWWLLFAGLTLCPAK
jgi:hypothetical protein